MADDSRLVADKEKKKFTISDIFKRSMDVAREIESPIRSMFRSAKETVFPKDTPQELALRDVVSTAKTVKEKVPEFIEKTKETIKTGVKEEKEKLSREFGDEGVTEKPFKAMSVASDFLVSLGHGFVKEKSKELLDITVGGGEQVEISFRNIRNEMFKNPFTPMDQMMEERAEIVRIGKQKYRKQQLWKNEIKDEIDSQHIVEDGIIRDVGEGAGRFASDITNFMFLFSKLKALQVAQLEKAGKLKRATALLNGTIREEFAPAVLAGIPLSIIDTARQDGDFDDFVDNLSVNTGIEVAVLGAARFLKPVFKELKAAGDLTPKEVLDATRKGIDDVGIGIKEVRDDLADDILAQEGIITARRASREAGGADDIPLKVEEKVSKELEPLIEEAKKFKTADEFVGVIKGGTPFEKNINKLTDELDSFVKKKGHSGLRDVPDKIRSLDEFRSINSKLNIEIKKSSDFNKSLIGKNLIKERRTLLKSVPLEVQQKIRTGAISDEQLMEIFNKATKALDEIPKVTKELKSLVEEAKKFKTADEFIRKNAGVSVSGSISGNEIVRLFPSDKVRGMGITTNELFVQLNKSASRTGSNKVFASGIGEEAIGFYEKLETKGLLKNFKKSINKRGTLQFKAELTDNAKKITTSRLKEIFNQAKKALAVKPDADKLKGALKSIGDKVLPPKEGDLIVGKKDKPAPSKKSIEAQVSEQIDTRPIDSTLTKDEITSAELYDKNFKMSSGSVTTNKVIKSFTRGLNKALTPISTRLKEIDPSLKTSLRKYEFNVLNKVQKARKTIEPFLEGKAKKMSKRDLVDFDLAEKNRDSVKIANLLEKYGLEAEYKKKREVLDSLFNEAKDAGYDVNFLEDFSPRKVKDSEGFLEHLQSTGEWATILEAIQAKEKQLQRNLSIDEKAIIANKMLRGFPQGNILLSKPKALKERQIDVVDGTLNQFYASSDDATLEYIDAVIDAVEGRKFFARNITTKPLGKTPSTFTTQDATQIQDSIGAYTMNLLADGKITISQEKDLQSILMARFNPGRMNPSIGLYRNLSYIDTMGSVISAITQIGDLGFALYKSGFYKTVKAVLTKSKVTMEEIGIDKIAQEFTEQSTSQKAVETVFKAVGLTAMDRLGKNTLINSSLDRFQGLARKAAKSEKAMKSLKKQLSPIFGKETDQLIKDLQKGDNTENVKLLLFNELSDIQPISLTEMPETYLKSGNGRIFYMLKTFTIKQFDVFRNEVFHELQKGNIKKGLSNFVKLSASLMLMNATADEIKDLILGRETSLTDRVVDNILKLMGFSKYTIYQARTQGTGEAIISLVAPPVGFINAVSKDIDKLTREPKEDEEGDEKSFVSQSETVRSVPIGGKLYYWWFGRGAEKSEKKRAKYKKDEVTKMTEQGDLKEAQEMQKKLQEEGTLSERTNLVRKSLADSYSIPSIGNKKIKDISKNDKIKIATAKENMTTIEWSAFVNSFTSRSTRRKYKKIANIDLRKGSDSSVLDENEKTNIRQSVKEPKKEEKDELLKKALLLKKLKASRKKDAKK